MDATLYDLDAMRSRQRIRTRIEGISYAQTVLDGLALTRGVLSFWDEYCNAIASFHANLLSAAFSPSLKPQKIEAKPRNWL